MQKPDPIDDPANHELEAALARLAPAHTRIDPVQAAFEAGRRAQRRSLRHWQLATAAMLVLGAGSWLMLLRPSPSTLDRGSTIQVVRSEPRSLPEQSLILLDRTVRDQGAEGLPATRLPRAVSIDASDAL